MKLFSALRFGSTWNIRLPMVATLETPAVSTPETLPVGRPSEFNEQIAADVCRHVRAGFTVRALSAKLGFDDCTLYDWQHAHPEFADQVAQARRFAAGAWADKAAEAAASAMADPGERGERARGAAVMVGNAQWQAERRDPANWGQRSALAIDARVTVAGETAVTMADFVAAARSVVAGVGVPAGAPAASALPAVPVASPVVELPAASVVASVPVISPSVDVAPAVKVRRRPKLKS